MVTMIESVNELLEKRVISEGVAKSVLVNYE